MTHRQSWLVFVGLALAALAALLVAGTRQVAARTFVLRGPNQEQVLALGPSKQVCEGPVASQGPVQSVGIWGSAIGAPTTLNLVVKDASNRRLISSGRVHATTVVGAQTAAISSSEATGRPLSICVINIGRNPYSLVGSPAVSPKVVMSGSTPGLEFSLVLLHHTGESLLGSLGRAFARASLFRPAWVDAWTYWALAGMLLATIGLGAVAIRAAAGADETIWRRSDDHEPGNV